MRMRITVTLIEKFVDEAFTEVAEGNFDFLDDADLLVVISDYVEGPVPENNDKHQRDSLFAFVRRMMTLREGGRLFMYWKGNNEFRALSPADLERVYRYIFEHPLLEEVRHLCLTTPLHFRCIDGPLCIALIESQKKYPTRTNGK